MAYRDYDVEKLTNAVRDSVSVAGVLRLLGKKPAGGNFYTMKKKIQELNLDTSHFTGQLWSKGERLKDWTNYAKPKGFRKHFLKEKNYTCESCGLSEWLNRPIALEVHHIDGDRTNNDLTNLQCLCPNCHAFTDNWRGKGVGKGI